MITAETPLGPQYYPDDWDENMIRNDWAQKRNQALFSMGRGGALTAMLGGLMETATSPAYQSPLPETFGGAGAIGLRPEQAQATIQTMTNANQAQISNQMQAQQQVQQGLDQQKERQQQLKLMQLQMKNDDVEMQIQERRQQRQQEQAEKQGKLMETSKGVEQFTYGPDGRASSTVISPVAPEAPAQPMYRSGDSPIVRVDPVTGQATTIYTPPEKPAEPDMRWVSVRQPDGSVKQMYVDASKYTPENPLVSAPTKQQGTGGLTPADHKRAWDAARAGLEDDATIKEVEEQYRRNLDMFSGKEVPPLPDAPAMDPNLMAPEEQGGDGFRLMSPSTWFGGGEEEAAPRAEGQPPKGIPPGSVPGTHPQHGKVWQAPDGTFWKE